MKQIRNVVTSVIFAVTVASLLDADATVAQDRQMTHQLVDGRKVSKPWREVVGKRVTAEGLAWGAYDKGLGQRLVLDGSTIYIRDVDFLKLDVNGKLVRVSGILRVGEMKAAPANAGGYGSDFTYYYVEADRLDPIETVKSPWLRETKEISK